MDKTPGQDEHRRRHAEARGAEPQPAHVRRRRVAVRGRLRPARVPDVELPRPRREPDACRCRPAIARRTTSSRSPSRSCSTATSPAASTSTSASLQYIGYYTQKSTGGNLMFGFPVADFSRMFINYAYETVRMTDLNEALIDPVVPAARERLLDHLVAGDLSQLTPTQRRDPAAQPVRLRLAADRAGRPPDDQQGRCRASSTTPSTTRSSRTPGKRLTASIDLAVLGGNTQFYKPTLEGDLVLPAHAADLVRLPRRRSSTSRRSAARPSLPIFERLFLGGEYSVRGFDIRSIGPTDPDRPGSCSAATRACCSTPST